MTAKEYQEWAAHHATVFGFRDDDVSMIAAWYEILGVYGIEELRSATAAIAASQEHPAWPRNHLAAVVRQIASARARSFAGESVAARQPDRGSCDDCGGTGRVSVPHPRALEDGKWIPLVLTRSGCPVYYECAVFCHCGLGAWYRQHNRNGLTIEQYEQINPHWKSQLRARRSEDREVAGVEGGPLSGVLARLAKRYGMEV